MQSQVSAINEPEPKSWNDYEQGCLSTFGGGHHADGHLEAFRHGMQTVFSLLRLEFPPAEQCKAAPRLLEACKQSQDCLLLLRTMFEVCKVQGEIIYVHRNALRATSDAIAEATQT